jgi:hypothetical protein
MTRCSECGGRFPENLPDRPETVEIESTSAPILRTLILCRRCRWDPQVLWRRGWREART